MTKPLKLTHKQWKTLVEELKKDYKPCVVLLRSRMEKQLGFLPREYKDYDKENNRYRENCIMLDFYSEKKRTFMLMKYSHVLDKSVQ